MSELGGDDDSGESVGNDDNGGGGEAALNCVGRTSGWLVYSKGCRSGLYTPGDPGGNV